MLTFCKSYLPAFDLPDHADQYPVALYTVLSANESVGDCAAYQGIGPASPADHDALIQKVRAGGDKISEARARAMFDQIEDMGLRYRR